MSAILVIDGDGHARRAIRAALTSYSFQVSDAGTGAAGVVTAADRSPDLVILELDLPDIEGLEALRRLRGFSRVPVLVVTGRERQADRVAALESGADDVLGKPFDPNELRARVQAILRRVAPPETAADAQLRFGSLQIDLARRLVTSDGRAVHLTRTERRLLELLVTNPGRLLAHDVMLREIWGPGYHNQPNYLRTYVGQLRRKIGDSAGEPRLILTEPGVGYRWIGGEG